MSFRHKKTSFRWCSLFKIGARTRSR